ncbi:MAG: 30S ribosomal protein S2 [Actinobacteria bacterium]|nr:30S ribosomal protein S2 [Actinomycetota bacterium]
MAVVDIKDLLEAGVHFGHQTRRWNPKMKPFIFTERNDIYIIDLQKTLVKIGLAYNTIRNNVAGGGSVLFVGTKKQSQEAVHEHAVRCGMPYVNLRWLGGTLTNFKTIHGRVLYLKELQRREMEGELDTLPKKEALLIRRQISKLEKNLTGLLTMESVPGMIFVIDPKKERIAANEARKLGIPIIGLVDTNCDPDEVDYIIPGNDDAIRSIGLMCRVVADAVIDGQGMREARLADEMSAREAESKKAGEKPSRRHSEAVPAYSASPFDSEEAGSKASSDVKEEKAGGPEEAAKAEVHESGEKPDEVPTEETSGETASEKVEEKDGQ